MPSRSRRRAEHPILLVQREAKRLAPYFSKHPKTPERMNLAIDHITQEEAYRAIRGSAEDQLAIAVRYLTNCYSSMILGSGEFYETASKVECYHWLAMAANSGLEREVIKLAEEHPDVLSIGLLGIQREVIRIMAPPIPDNVTPIR